MSKVKGNSELNKEELLSVLSVVLGGISVCIATATVWPSLHCSSASCGMNIGIAYLALWPLLIILFIATIALGVAGLKKQNRKTRWASILGFISVIVGVFIMILPMIKPMFK